MLPTSLPGGSPAGMTAARPTSARARKRGEPRHARRVERRATVELGERHVGTAVGDEHDVLHRRAVGRMPRHRTAAASYAPPMRRARACSRVGSRSSSRATLVACGGDDDDSDTSRRRDVDRRRPPHHDDARPPSTDDHRAGASARSRRRAGQADAVAQRPRQPGRLRDPRPVTTASTSPSKAGRVRIVDHGETVADAGARGRRSRRGNEQGLLGLDVLAPTARSCTSTTPIRTATRTSTSTR